MNKKKLIYQIVTIILIIMQLTIVFLILDFKAEQDDIISNQKTQHQLDELFEYEFKNMEMMHNIYFNNNFDINRYQNTQKALSNKPINIISNKYLFIQDANYKPLNYSQDEYDIGFRYLRNTMGSNQNSKFTDFVTINNEVYYQTLFTIYDMDFSIIGHSLIQHKIDEDYLEKLKSIIGFDMVQVKFPKDIFLIDKHMDKEYFQNIKDFLYKDTKGKFEVFIKDDKVICIYKSYNNSNNNSNDFISIYLETNRNSASMQMIWLTLLVTFIQNLILSIILFLANNIDDIFYRQEKEFTDISSDLENIQQSRILKVVNKLDSENSESQDKLNDKINKVNLINNGTNNHKLLIQDDLIKNLFKTDSKGDNDE